MNPIKIKYKMELKGLTQTEIARKLGVSQSLLSGVIHGYKKSKRVRKFLASKLGYPVEKIWPP